MKLAYIANIRIPTEKAHGKQIVKTCESFADHGVEVVLVAPDRKNELKDQGVYSFYGVRNNFSIKKIRSFDPRFLLSLPSGTYIKFQTIFFLVSLKKYLKNIETDFIYTRDFYLLPVLKQAGKKVIWEVHDLPKNKSKYASYWSNFYKIITITQNLKDELVRLGVEESKIVVAPDAVDLERFTSITKTVEELRQELNLPLEKNIIMYSGHLYGWKGADILAKAANDLTENEQVIIMGGTDEDIEKFRKEFGDVKNLFIIGRKPFDQVARYLKAADVLVLPNSAKLKISSHYTSPMKLFEYMAAGQPIVASNLPSIVEVLNASNSVLVKADNPRDLVTGIEKILADQNLANNISENAFLDVKSHTWEKRAEKIIHFIQ